MFPRSHFYMIQESRNVSEEVYNKHHHELRRTSVGLHAIRHCIDTSNSAARTYTLLNPLDGTALASTRSMETGRHFSISVQRMGSVI